MISTVALAELGSRIENRPKATSSWSSYALRVFVLVSSGYDALWNMLVIHISNRKIINKQFFMYDSFKFDLVCGQCCINSVSVILRLFRFIGGWDPNIRVWEKNGNKERDKDAFSVE